MKTDLMQNSNESAPAINVWVGLDWADKNHLLAVQSAGAAMSSHQVEQKPEALEAFFLQLRQRFPSQTIGVCLEQSRGPVIYALMKYDFLVLYPVNPSCLADFRKAFKVSGAKNDPTDAALLCELAGKHHQRLRPLRPEDAVTRRLRFLVEARRDFVDQRTAISNRIGAALKCYYPLALEWMGDKLTGPMALEFLRRWPNLAKLNKAKPAVLRSFFYAYNSRSEDKIQERLDSLKTAKPLTEDDVIIQSLQLEVTALVQQATLINKVIAEYDEQIRQTFATHSEKWLFADLPGAGEVLAPRLAAAFGTIRNNLASVMDLLCMTGVAPVQKQSGQQKVVHFRFARSKFLHQSIVEFAKCSIGGCQWAQLLFEDQRRRGKSAYAAIRVVAFKWLRILWRCWKDQKPYDESRYLRSLQNKGIKLYQSLYSPQPSTTASC